MTRFSTASGLTRLMMGAALVALATIPMQGGHAATAADTLIQNQATATYTDENGNVYRSQSNLSSITVQQVYSATLSQDRSVTASAGQTVYFSHTLTNTGNGEDTYTLAVAQNNTNDAVDNAVRNFENLAVYVDANGNGQLDAGENLASTVTIPAGESVELVVVGKIPGGAADNVVFGATLTATASQGDVIDLTASAGADGANGTNEVTATVTGDAVLNISKQSVHNVAARQITYTVTVTNTGRLAARDVALFDGLPAGTTLVGTPTFNGFGAAIDTGDRNVVAGNLDETAIAPDTDLNGDGDFADATETALGVDLDGDGATTGGTLPGVYGFDDLLPPNTTIDMSFTVQYPVGTPANTVFNNTGYVTGDIDGDVNTDDGVVPSNRVTDIAPQTYQVAIDDTGVANGGTPGVNDGEDDDETANGIQTVDTAPSGALVLFDNVITNRGNGTDTFEITFANSATNPYPAGTVFSAWNETGSTQLLDTNNDGTVDTGPMIAGEVRNIQIRVQLPSNVPASATGPFEVTTTTTSANDPTSLGNGGPTSDTKIERLLAISAPGVDLANSAADGLPGTNKDALAVDSGTGEYDPTTTLVGNPGDTVTFPLTIQNDSGSSDSFQLFAGGSTPDGVATGALPAGWQVIFRDATGKAITTTPAIQPGSAISLTADVVIPSDLRQALANRSANVDGDAALDTIDGNGDNDGDYAIFFRTVSVNSGATDIKLDAVDVAPVENVTIAPNNSGQVQPGGSIEYPHTLRNDGNTVESFTLAGSNSLATSSWGNALLVDTTGNGIADTAFAALATGAPVYYVNAAGTLVSQTFDGDIELRPGESLNLTARVLAPNSAPNGQLDALSVTATYNGTGSTVTAIDQTRVVLGQLRLVKTASVDDQCLQASGAADLSPDVPFQVSANGAEPGDCVIWQVVATNEGTSNVQTVEIADTVPAFTEYEPDTLRICKGDAGRAVTPNTGCTFSTLSDGAGAPDDEGRAVNGDVIYTLGAGASPVVTGGSLAPGETVTVRFATEVE